MCISKMHEALDPHQMPDHLIAWPDGVARGPHDRPMREVVQRRLWTSTVWCSEDGLVWRRHWDVASRAWRWAGAPAEPVLDDAGRLGVRLEDGWVPLALAIGRAWCHRAEDAAAHDPAPLLPDEGRPLHARHLAWREGETSREEGARRGERWKALRWRCGAVRCARAYEVSSHGRLRSPRGGVTRGFAHDGRRWAAAEAEGGAYGGLVDLTTASGLRPPALALPPRLVGAAGCLVAGHAPAELAACEGIQLGTAWGYFQRAAPHVDPRALRSLAPRLVARDLWALLSAMAADGEPAFGARLLELMEAVRARLPPDGEFRSAPCQMEQLRFARVCLVAAR